MSSITYTGLREPQNLLKWICREFCDSFLQALSDYVYREGFYEKFFLQKRRYRRHKSPEHRAQGRERFHQEDTVQVWKRCHRRLGHLPGAFWDMSRQSRGGPDLVLVIVLLQAKGWTKWPADIPLRQLWRGFINFFKTCDIDLSTAKHNLILSTFKDCSEAIAHGNKMKSKSGEISKVRCSWSFSDLRSADIQYIFGHLY